MAHRTAAIQRSIAQTAPYGVMLSLVLHGGLVALLLCLPSWDNSGVEEPAREDLSALTLPGPEPVVATLREFPPIDTTPLDMTPRIEAPMANPKISPASTGPITQTSATRGSPVITGGAMGPSSGLGLFPIASQVRTVVFVLDRSLSMGLHNALTCARRELLYTLGELPPTMRFQIIAYNRQVEPLYLNGHGGYLTADATVVGRVADWLAELTPNGGTDHVRALKRGLSFQADLLYFVTDADDLTPQDVQAITQQNQGRTSIHVLELNGSQQSGESRLLRELAARNRGAFRRVAPQ